MSSSKKKSGGGLASLFRDAGEQAKSNLTAIHEPILIVPNEDGTIRPTQPQIFNVLEYIEGSWGLNLTLYPVQRFIVKLYYHLPLDNKEKSIVIKDMFGEKIIGTFTEQEYLSYLYNEGRCNIGEQDHERRELILACGRRGGKTTLSGIFASYEVYRLLNLYHPQSYYGLPPGNRIQIISIATDKEQASLLFNEVSSHTTRCEYFKPYVASSTLSDIKFRTPHDIEKFGTRGRGDTTGKFTSLNGKSSLRVTFKSCIAKGLRGSGNIVIIMDEMAHYQAEGQSSADDIYAAVVPSAAAFSPKNPEDTTQPIGDVESRIISISSPLNKSGKFFTLFNQAMSGGPAAHNLLAIQAPTWELNPTIASSYYRQKFHADPNVFMTEHGAQFSDRVRGWIEREEDLMRCVDPELRPTLQGYPRQPHQMGIDIALKNDATVFAITVIQDDKIVLAYHEVWKAKEDWMKSNPHLPTYSCPYARLLGDIAELDFDEIANWIEKLCKRFYITNGIFDRWNGLPLQQTLNKRGLTQFESRFFTRDEKSKMYQTTKLLMANNQISLYDYPYLPGDKKHSPLIQELLTLQAEQLSQNVIVVKAPEGPEYHDDQSDALVRAITLSYSRMVDTKSILGSTGKESKPSFGTSTVGHYQLRRARMHGGVGMERTIPRNIGIGGRMGRRR